LKIPKRHLRPHKTSSWVTCGPRVWGPWSSTTKHEKTRSHITFQRVG